jgi:tryptophan-rich sensory protein
MGVSLYLLWRHRHKAIEWKGALVWFGVQLLLNALWSLSFFGLRSPFIGLVNIILLWGAIVLTIFHCFKLSRTAAILLTPYLLWVSFAAALNFSIWRLNV